MSLRRAALLAPLVALAAVGVAARAQAPVPALPPVVRAIEVRSDARLESAEKVRSLLAFDVGDPLTDVGVRRSLRNLEASGLAARVAIYRRPAADGEGVVATVALWANVIVDAVEVAGDTGVLKRSELRAAVPQREGEPLMENRLVRGVFALQDLFEGRGYYRRTVTLDPTIDEAAKRATVVYKVAAGPRATVGEVRFDGPIAPFSAAALTAQLKLKPGEPYRKSAAADDAERLRGWLIGKEYRAARVDEPGAELGPAGDTVVVTYPIDVGPKVSVTVDGADRDKLRKKGLLPFLGSEGYDEALVLQAVERLKDYYQRQGHYKVAVSDHETKGEGSLDLTIAIAPGPVFTLQEIRFTGNDQVSDGQLRALMETSARSLLSSAAAGWSTVSWTPTSPTSAPTTRCTVSVRPRWGRRRWTSRGAA